MDRNAGTQIYDIYEIAQTKHDKASNFRRKRSVKEQTRIDNIV